MRSIGAILIAAGLVLSVAYAFLIFYTEERYLPEYTIDGKGMRIVQDNYDRSAYHRRGAWYLFGMEHVGDLESEYPALAVYVFAIPFAIADLAGRSDPRPEPQLILNLLTAMMVPFYLGLMLIIRELLHETGKSEWRLFVFLLPGFLYFSLNRYDLLPALIVAASILLAFNNRPVLTGFLLGLGIMVKWYPVLLAPTCFGYFWHCKKEEAFLFGSSLILTALLSSLPLLLIGGTEAFLDPYRFQMGRGTDATSLFGLIAFWKHTEIPSYGQAVLLALQLAVPLLALLGAYKSREAILDWTLLSLFAFVFFAKFYSPQWMIWIVPLLILRVESRWWVALIVIWDILSYLLFPVLYDVYGIYDHPPSGVFATAVLLKTALIIALASVPARGAFRDFWALREGR